MRLAHLFAACAVAIATALPAAAHEGVHVTEAFARFLPGAKAGAAFMAIENHATKDDRLVSAFSRVAGKVELHAHKMSDDGMARMMAMPEGLTIPAGQTVTLQSGGDHLMFMDLAEVPVDGATVPVTLVFENAGEVTLDIPVDNARAMGASDSTGTEPHAAKCECPEHQSGG